jgi:hypothetical protein
MGLLLPVDTSLDVATSNNLAARLVVAPMLILEAVHHCLVAHCLTAPEPHL